MRTMEAGTPVKVKNILYLTDFSKPSEAALPFAITCGRGCGAKVHALHVLIPRPYLYTTPELTMPTIQAEEDSAQAEMQRIESQLAGLPHDAAVVRGLDVWPAVEKAIKAEAVDLIVLGTHGRTGAEKLLLGSVTEEIFRRSPVPVLTIGPDVRSSVHSGGRFHRVLFATDFSPESLAAAPYAISLAEQYHSHLALITVLRKPEELNDSDKRIFELSVAEVIHRLYEVVPDDAKLDFSPQVSAEYGEPADRIVEIAKQRGADLIVLGVRGAAGRLGAATHLERATAHRVVAHAACPVLTVRG
ncbi:MAG: universal stress protein [Candidatus Acidiferrales bacterium]|jgi:nucleotide-binding universal stress UspA family protein